jgi:CRP-like cAMP-binding protein
MACCGRVVKMESSILNLFSHAENLQKYPAGEVIFVEGEPGKTMYVVLEGEVNILVSDKVLDVAGPGDLVGEMALIDSSARSATAIAKEDCVLVPVDERQFLRMVDQTPIFALNVMKVLADRLRRVDSML